MPDKVLVFDVWGDYAHFRKYYTTSSPLSFSIPPRTALIGLISAIVGLEKEEYLYHMTKDKARIAVRLLNSVKKVRLGLNLVDTKGGETRLEHWRIKPRWEGTNYRTGRTQIRFEFLKDPKYRIYFQHREEELHRSLRQNLSLHKSVYTPYLGISELLANFEYVGELAIVEMLREEELSYIHSVLPLDTISEIKLLEGYKFFKERIPTEMLPGRVVTEYREVLYEAEGKPIQARVKGGMRLENGECIVPL